MSFKETYNTLPRQVVDPRESRESYAESGLSSDDYLGDRYLYWSDRATYLRQTNLPEFVITDAQRNAQLGLDRAREELKQASGKKYTADLIESYPIPQTILENIDSSDEPFASKLADVSDETLAEFLEWNREYIDLMAERKQGLIEEYVAEFSERISRAVNEQGLPIPRKQLQQRLAQPLSIRFSDPIAMKLAGQDGGYDAKGVIIRVAGVEDQDHIRKIIFHEMLHHLSGQTVVAETAYIDNEHTESGLQPRRVGFGIRSLEDLSESRKWLNEAVTEQLAQILLRKEGEQINFRNIGIEEFFAEPFNGGFYQKERSVLMPFIKFMDQKGLNSLIAAYFEDHKPKGDSGTKSRMPKRKRFYQQLRRAYGLNIAVILKDLDESYEEQRFEDMKTTLRTAKLVRTIFR